MQTAVTDLAALLVVLAGLTTGINLREHARCSAPIARHFPGLPAKPAHRPAVQPQHWLLAAAVDAFAVVALMLWNASGTATLLVALAGFAGLSAMAWPIHKFARDCAWTTAAIAAVAPRLAMPLSGGMPAHVGVWAPYIQRTGQPWCVVADSPALLDELAAKYDIPMIVGSLPATVRVALYSDDSDGNAAFLAAKGVKHIFLGHGDSDKPLGRAGHLLNYDMIAVAGQAAIDRFAAAGLAVSPERLKVIGRPQTEGIARATGPMSAIATPTVLYAPTWRHAEDSRNVSSLIVGDKIVQRLLDRGVTVLFRTHFAARDHVETEAMIETIHDLLEQDAAATGLEHVWGEAASAELPLVDAFNLADAMICDVSSIVVDFMQSEKPFAMYAAQVGTGPDLATTFRTAHPTAEGAYVIDRELINIDTIFNLMLGPDPLSPTRTDRAAYYLGDGDRAQPAQRFIDFVNQLSG